MYLCVLDPKEETEQGVRNLANKFKDIWNKYAANDKNNMKKVTYRGDITGGVATKDLESLDHYAITREFISFALGYYHKDT